MKTEWKDVAHLYIGCLVADSYSGENVEMVGFVSGGEEPIYVRTNKVIGRRNFNEIKPLLRKFPDDMTEEDEEATGLNKTYEGGHDTLHPTDFLYFLKQGFDLFNLINSGQAIDKTKLP